MHGEANDLGDIPGSVRSFETVLRLGPSARPRNTSSVGAIARTLASVGLAVLVSGGEALAQKQEGPAPDVVVYASDLPESALSEFDFWNDAASPGGKMIGTPNRGDELDPPPENDPHVTFKVRVQRGIPYRCWIHIKVGKPKGKSQANLFFVQFTDVVDANREIFAPGTASYLSVRGPAAEGWAWTGRDLADPQASEPRIYFRTSGEVTVRMQAGMEGVGFDQFILSPARFQEKPPSEAVVAKPR